MTIVAGRPSLTTVTELSESDLADLRAALRGVLERESSEDRVRTTMATDTGVDSELWSQLVSDFDLPSLTAQEEHGGVGAGWAAQRVVLEELGAALACVPALSVLGLAIPALVASADSAAIEDLLPDLLSGKRIATAALLGPDPVAACAVTATRDSDSSDAWTLSGTIAHVLDAAVADAVLALARHDGGLALFAIDTHDNDTHDTNTQAHGVTVTARRTSDLTRRVASITLDAAPARLVGGLDQGAAIAAAVRPQALLALACEQTGGAQAALDQAVAYAGQRQQFGRAIGSFQAVKHKLADVLIAVEESRSATWATARALDAADSGTGTDSGSDATLFALATAAVCSTAYVKAASDNVQVHGGIGYTWEHGAHLHVKRSRGSAVLFGTPAEHRQALSRLLPLLQDPATTAPTSIPSAVDADRTPVTEGASR